MSEVSLYVRASCVAGVYAAVILRAATERGGNTSKCFEKRRALGGVPCKQKMLKGDLSRVIYPQVY